VAFNAGEMVNRRSFFGMFKWMIVMSGLLACHLKKTLPKSFAIEPDVRLLRVLYEYIKVDKEFQDNRLITLTLINDRICPHDYALSSVNYILDEIITPSPLQSRIK
jgi:hypothetical protein